MLRHLIAAFLAIAPPVMQAAEPAAVLNGDSPFRLYFRWQTPTVAAEGGERKPLLEKKRRGQAESDRQPVKQVASLALPEGWTQPGFDDRGWARSILPIEFAPDYKLTVYEPGNPAEWSLVAARGKFLVSDPAAAGDMLLSVAYAGGVVVYVNGRELMRAHLPKGEVTPDTWAEKYPDAAYVDDEGHKLPLPDRTQEHADRFALRVRRIENVSIPAGMLRKGVNVLAVEARRAPLGEVWLAAPYRRVTDSGPWGPFGHVGMLDVRLTAAAGSGVTGNAARPAGVQLWTCGAWENLLVWDRGGPAEEPAVTLSGVRNGAFSGRIVLGSTGPIRGAKAMPSALAGPDGASIPASAVQVRYAALSGRDTSWIASRASGGLARFDRLLEGPPAEVAVVDLPVPKPNWRLEWLQPQTQPAPAAVLPVWVTVHVPADARPGRYEGTVTVQADGLKPTAVPLSIAVHGWALPEPKRWVSHNNVYQSHESTALYYGAEFWSEEHFRLMGRVLELGNLAANKFCVVHLVHPAYHMGNRESMVRWIDVGGGRYEHDFSVFDRYLDLYAARCGKPGLLLLTVFAPWADQRVRTTGKPQYECKVSLLDRPTGKVRPMPVPDYGTPESVAFWRPVLEAARKRLQKRGWWDVAVLGTGSDEQPMPETVAAFRQALPDATWMSSSHMRPMWYRSGGSDKVPVYERESVWGTGQPYDPDGEKTSQYPRPWRPADRYREWAFPRVGQAVCYGLYDSSRLVLQRAGQEGTLQGGITGFGRIGLDFLPLPDKDRPEQYLSLCGQIGAHLGPAASTRAIVGAGPKGPVATERLEAFREGLQVREAMIFLQKALDGGKLPEGLSRRCTELLDDRARAYLRAHPGSPAHWTAYECDLPRRDDALFALCAEAAAP